MRRNMHHGTPKHERIRVLHLVNGLYLHGAEVALFHYIRALGTEHYDHYVYFLGVDGPVRERLEALGVPVFEGKKRGSIKNPITFFVSLLSLIIDLLLFIRNKNIQIIKSETGMANQLAVAVAKLSGRAVFPTVHTTMAFVDERSCWDPRVYLNRVVNRVIYRIADNVLAVSPEIRKIICEEQRVENSRVTVLKNGIVLDNNFLHPLDIEKEFPDSRNKLKLIAVGRLVPLKCFDVLVRGMAEALIRGSEDLFLAIVGEGEERSKLEELILTLGIASHVKLLGLRHDVMALMKGSDIFIIPSLYEGLSIAMIEAMACGLPIVASDAPGLRGYVKKNQNGVLFPVGDHKALADRIIHLARNRKLIAELSRGARATFEKEYDMRKNIKILDTLFRKYGAVN